MAIATNMYFECTVSYEKVLENGLQKKVSELYLVKAVSFTDAEKVITEYITPYISGEFSIQGIKRAKYSELFTDSEGDRYFKATVGFVTLDEKSGKEKQSNSVMLVQADTLEKALDNLQKGMQGTLADYKSVKIEETKLMDVVTENEVVVKS